MVFAVRDLMQDAYPELNETADRVSKTVLAEEKRFAHTLDIGPCNKLETRVADVQNIETEQILSHCEHPTGEARTSLQSL